MIDLFKLAGRNRRNPRAILGLAFDGARVEGAVLRLSNGNFEVTGAFTATLTVPTDSGDPAAAGRELRAQLDAVGIRERNCVVALPCAGLLVTQTELPAMPEADAASLLQIEAEKGFHSDVTGLRVGDSRCVLPDGRRFVTLSALPQARFAFLEQVLVAARSKAAGLSPAISELQAPGAANSDGVVAILLSPGSGQAGLQVTVGGGIAALRSIEGAIDASTEPPAIRIDPVAREIRITLGQLPESLEKRVRRIRIFGPRALAESMAAGLNTRLGPAGFSVETALQPASTAGRPALPSTTPFNAAVIAAARFLAGEPACLEFLPPRPSAVERFLARHTTGPLRTTWVIGGAIAAILGGAFLIQQIQLSILESKWSHMSAEVKQLDLIQQQTRQYRPWATDSFRSLRILEALTKAFPENGGVTAKLIEIRESGDVVCNGTASESPALLMMMDRLNATPGVSNLHRDQIRGKAPLLFNFTFHWSGGDNP